jgi:hypothetical protein
LCIDVKNEEGRVRRRIWPTCKSSYGKSSDVLDFLIK